MREQASPQAKRGRPRAFDGDELVEASVDVFWRHGINGATTRVLETELGISQSSLYNAYGSKEGLLDQTVARYERRLNAMVLSRLDEPSREALVDFVDAVVRWVGQDEHPGCLVLNLSAEDPDHAYRLKIYRTKLRRGLKPSVKTFTEDKAEADVRTELLLAAVLGLNLSAKSGASRAELRRIGNGIKHQINAW